MASPPRSPSCSRSGQLAPADRGRYLKRAAGVLADEMEEVAGLLTAEQGKPIAESYTMEILPTIDALNCAEAGPAILSDEILSAGLPEDEEELFLLRADRWWA